jgi:dihydroorotase
MFILLNATIIQAGKKPVKRHILTEKGRILDLVTEVSPSKSDQVRDLHGAWVMPGWFDTGVHACDPGFEHREDLQSVMAAAKAGGFTSIAVMPDTQPVTDNRSQIRYVIEQTQHADVQVLPIGALSVHLEGKDMAELMDMREAGAIAFADGQTGIQDAGLLKRALEYCSAFGGLILNRPHHKSIASGGQMHEGVQSTMLGLKGLAALAETLVIQRDLSILRYTGGRLHMHLISCAESVELIRAAKSEGLQVTCSVAMSNLCFTDQALSQFESKYKVYPPLRTETDRQALIQAVKDGTIDCISTAHTPWHIEAKDLEFTYAEFGMTGLETAFSMYQMFLAKDLTPGQFAQAMSSGPRKVFGLEEIKIKVGTELKHLSYFDPKLSWVYDAKSAQSKAHNHPLFGSSLVGKAIAL